MKVVPGRVEQGRVVVDEPLPEGADVAVFVAADDEAFDLMTSKKTSRTVTRCPDDLEENLEDGHPVP